MKGVDDKRRYLFEQKVSRAPAWLRPFLRRFRFLRKLWSRHCFRVIMAMNVGEVLNEYYSYTEK